VVIVREVDFGVELVSAAMNLVGAAEVVQGPRVTGVLLVLPLQVLARSSIRKGPSGSGGFSDCAHPIKAASSAWRWPGALHGLVGLA